MKSMTGIYYLRALHTKQLLNLRKEYSQSLICGNRVRYTVDDRLVSFTYDELKQVLSERPHIPRKLETRAIRQKSAKSRLRSYQSSK
jgi:hypothetical protein